MNNRQRFLETMHFGHPDRIPLAPGWPRESTLATWHQQGLPEGCDWRVHLAETLGLPTLPNPAYLSLGVHFEMQPTFEEKLLAHHHGHYIVQDWMGAITEISDGYDYTYIRSAKDFVTRKWHRFPVQSRQDWIEKIRWRYDPDDPSRFPADFESTCQALQDRQEVLSLSFNGPFWQLREWLGFEGLCLAFATQPAWVEEMVEFWTVHGLCMLDKILSHTTLDQVQVNEDMAYKLHSMISPGMVRRFLLPAWQQWLQRIKTSSPQAVLLVDSDGYITELVPLWIEAGFDATWPVEVAAGNDLVALRRKYGKNLAYGGGIDKRALAQDSLAIQGELARLAPVLAQGGYLPGCDHGVPPDISWPNFIEYTRRLAQLTGWL